MISGYNEDHAGGYEVFPIEIEAGVSVVHSGDPGSVNIWSSDPTPPSALIALKGVSSGTAPLTVVEDLVLIGAERGIHILDRTTDTNPAVFTEFLGRISRCHFGWNEIAVDLYNNAPLLANLTLRECRIRTNFGNPQAGSSDPPNLQSPAVGMRFVSLARNLTSGIPQINVEIRNLLTLGSFSSMAPGAVYRAGPADFPNGLDDFTRLIEVATEGTIQNLEHGAGTGFAPIPEVNLSIVGGNLDGMADPNNLNAGWDIGIFATTTQVNDGEHKDFSSGYRIETSGTEIDRFKVSGIHCVTSRWGRGELTLNGGTKVHRTGHQADPTTDLHLYNGVHATTIESYFGLHATGAEISNNRGNGVLLKTQSSIWVDDHKAPTGNFIDFEGNSIHQNGNHGLVQYLENDGIVGGTWHFPNGNRSLFTSSNFNYSVDYGQGVVNRCDISNNGKAGLFFKTNARDDHGYVSSRFVNCIIWNNPQGGYLADLRGDDSTPYFLAPIGHCTLAGNGDSSSFPYSLEILEEDRSAGVMPKYLWVEGNNELTTKFYNSVFERKSSNNDDFNPNSFLTSPPQVIDNSFSPTAFQIGAAGIRYQDNGLTSTFHRSTKSATPFVDTSTWSTLDPTKFYLTSHGIGGDFGLTPNTFPLEGTETSFDHAGNSRDDASTGNRDKGAHEYQ